MDIDKSTQEAEQWKKKYFDQLEDSERKEKQWNDADELLRKTISRLTLAADGIDDILDRQLRELRNAIRDRASTAQLRTRIDEMSKTLVKLDRERQQKQQATNTDPLLELLEALSLPRGTGRQTKVLKKQLDAGSDRDNQAVVHAFAALIHSAIELSSDESFRGPETGTKSGLFQRLFGSQDKEAEAETGPAVAEPASVGSAATPQSTGIVREILIKLLERLSLPDELVGKVEAIRDRIEKIKEGESWDTVLEEIADLVQVIRTQTQKEKQGIEEFLLQLTERLQAVDRQLQGSEQYYDDSREAGEQLDTAIKSGINGIESSVREATDMDQLKQAVQLHIDTVLTHMEKHQQAEQLRYEQAKEKIAAMGERLHDMENEAQNLRSRLKEERNQAMVDALTGIPNRLAYEERLEQEVARWKRFSTPLILVVWDIDHFKKINDSFGHKAGDKVLRKIANVLADGVRETDFVARYGGEEFVQLMTGSTLEECLPVADKLRVAVEATGFHFRGEAITITASCGLAEIRDGENTEQWFERADKALYKAKQEGRNRCETAQA